MMSSSIQERSKVTYSTIDEQERIRHQLRTQIPSLPSRENLFLHRGSWFAFGINLIPAFTYWRAAHRGYKLSKFSKARVSAPFFAAFVALQGAIVHDVGVKHKLDDLYNDFTMFSYCRTAFLWECYVLPSGFLLTTSFPFVLAVNSHLIPVPLRFLDKANRLEGFKSYFKLLKPYSRSMIVASVIAQAAIVLLGALEFHQYKNILAKFNRKYIHKRED